MSLRKKEVALVVKIGLALLCLSSLFPPRVWKPDGYTSNGTAAAPRSFLYSGRLLEATIPGSDSTQSAVISLEKMIAEMVLIVSVTSLAAVIVGFRDDEIRL